MNEQERDDVVQGLLRARAAAMPLAPPSQTIPNMNLIDAYRVQRSFVEGVLDVETIGGFKAALTGEAAQQAFSMTEPITGVLYSSGLRRGNTTVSMTEFTSLLLETEIGFRIGERITSPLTTITELREHVQATFPMVEFADPRFGDAKASGLDLIAANAASAAYLLGDDASSRGDEPRWGDVDLNAVNVIFSRDGELLHEATANDVMGDQWEALFWLVNQIAAQGYCLEPGHLMMTGSIGRLHPAKPGSYVADYGDFGKLTFNVM